MFSFKNKYTIQDEIPRDFFLLLIRINHTHSSCPAPEEAGDGSSLLSVNKS